MAADALPDQRLSRLKEALVAAGVVRGERDKTVAAVTGYAEGSTRRLLSGGTPLTGNFIKAVCIKFNIRWKWVKDGEEPMFARLGESPYPDLVQKDDSKGAGSGIGLSDAKVPAIAQPIAGLSYPRAIAGPEASVPRIAGGDEYVELFRDIRDKIKFLLKNVDNDGVLAWAVYSAFLDILTLPHHEKIDLVYQLRGLEDGDTDQFAGAVADAKLERYGIKRGATRLKLERIPVEPEEENQEK